MKTVKISYNPYKMKTIMHINSEDVCSKDSGYDKFQKFIANGIPLQTWIEPIEYEDWKGFVNEISDSETNDEVKLVFSGRKIDFEDLKRSIDDQNMKRSEETRVIYHYKHDKELDDKVLAQNIEEVVKEIKSDRFLKLINQRSTESLKRKYYDLDENYRLAKENVFYIVFAGAYSSGKSTLLNVLMRHSILPTSNKTCTSKNCRIRHDSSLGNKVSLTCFDKDDKIVIEKKIFDTDSECAAEFLKICPVRGNNTENEYQNVDEMELGVNLSHLYPNSVKEDKFTIVLVDTPGMDSAHSSKDGKNRHAEIALDAISMESKPMVILCVDAQYCENENIGRFMKKIIAQSREEHNGFSDRFLFLMNKSDSPTYGKDNSAIDTKRDFAEYLVDPSKWGIEDDDEQKQLAEAASHFVPRVFMTAGRVAYAIQCRAYEFSDEDINDDDKYDLLDKYDTFKDKIVGRKKRPDYYLSRHCDIPNYRKQELETEFQNALAQDNEQGKARATEIQCGLVAVESAIRDYIERYAYPIKVRDLLETFEDILEDVNSFANGTLTNLKKAEQELGEKEGERKEVGERKRGVEEKIATLNDIGGKIICQQKKLEKIQFDFPSLKKAYGEFRADIEESSEIRFIRQNPKVETGQKSHAEVENEINERISKIEDLFKCTLYKANKKLQAIKFNHDRQLIEVMGYLKTSVTELERSGVFKYGEYNFTDSVMWKMNFSNIDSESFASDMKESIVDKTKKQEKVWNAKKTEWRYSRNPFKIIGSLFMDDEITTWRDIDGYYDTTELRKKIDAYLLKLQRECDGMGKEFEQILDNSKDTVQKLTEKLIAELGGFLEDIKKENEKIEKIRGSISELDKEIKIQEETQKWLAELEEKIKRV